MDSNDETVKEVAKAAAEVAKFGTKSVGTTEKILRFTSKAIKEPVDVTSGIIGDRLKLFRWERQIAYTDKVNRILDEKGVEQTRAVPPKFTLPILEGASLEDSDDLQELWARLLANAMDPNFSINLRTAFADIIKSLEPLDVQILNLFYHSLEAAIDVDWNNVTDYSVDKQQICSHLNIDGREYEVSVFNLFRSQCLAPAIFKGGMKIGRESLTIYKGSSAVTITPLGVDFVRSCMKLG